MEFLIGGAATMAASVFTNPLEVAKTRMQLQGELKAKGQYTVHYKNPLHAVYTIARVDGIAALQKGLIPALWQQLFRNGIRLGIYQTLYTHGLTTDENGKKIFWKTMAASCFGAVCGASISSPFFMIKTRIQAQSSHIDVGYQHKHAGMTNALYEVFKQDGIKGLYRGVGAAIPRAAFGGTAQVTTFALAKDWMVEKKLYIKYPLFQSFLASMLSGIVVCLVMQPFDVVSTRLYNQGVDIHGRGLLYVNFFDCCNKIWKKEGIYGFYKGTGLSYFRLAPHTVLCLVFWDELNKLHEKYKSKNFNII